MGCYIWYSEEGPGRAGAPRSPILGVPNVTAHPSAASVQITVLLYDGPLLCGFNVAIKGLSPQRKEALRDGFVHFFVCSSVCRLKRVLVGQWPAWSSSASGRNATWPAAPRV